MEENLEKLFSGVYDNNSIKQNAESTISTLEFAFLGDTIFDLWTRNYLISKYKNKIKMNELHKKNSELVCAISQARIIEYLINNNFLTDAENDFYRTARNAHPHSKSKNSSIIDYRKATGFEALLGYLYMLGEINRLVEIFDEIKKIGNFY